MAKYVREANIIQNEKRRDGYVVTVSSLKEINDELKGYRVRVKYLKRGKIAGPPLFYEWISSKSRALSFFEMICRTIKVNLDNLGENKWGFHYHPVNFLLKHRN